MIEDLKSPSDISLIEGLVMEHLYFVYPGAKLHQIDEKIANKPLLVFKITQMIRGRNPQLKSIFSNN